MEAGLAARWLVWSQSAEQRLDSSLVVLRLGAIKTKLGLLPPETTNQYEIRHKSMETYFPDFLPRRPPLAL